jgi:hypothetical protein
MAVAGGADSAASERCRVSRHGSSPHPGAAPDLYFERAVHFIGRRFGIPGVSNAVKWL